MFNIVNIKYRITYLIWFIFSEIFHSKSIFIDTNIIVSNENDHDKRVSKLHKIGSKYFVTDIIQREINNLNKKNYYYIFKYKYKIVSYNGLREKMPIICPTYYNLISYMYNPANIASPEFYLHLLQSLKLRGRKLTKIQENHYMYFMTRLKTASNSVINSRGRKKNLLEKNIDKSAFQYFKKKIENKHHSNLLNDYKNISTIILYTLINKKNTIFVTADRDILVIILTLAESISQDMAFSHLFLKTLTDDDKRALLYNKKITRFLSFKEFKKYNKNLLGDILNSSWQKNYVSLRIKLWDTQEKRYVQELILKFDKVFSEYVLNMHGQLACPCAKNDIYGNWIGYKFWPPPIKSPDVLKFLLYRKYIINRENKYVPDSIHANICRYPSDEKKHVLEKYYGFWL